MLGGKNGTYEKQAVACFEHALKIFVTTTTATYHFSTSLKLSCKIKQQLIYEMVGQLAETKH